MSDARRHAPATARNRDPIAAVLRAELPSSGLVLEVASGTGEHSAYFASLFPALDWQPSDPDPSSLDSIEGWRSSAGCANIRPPIALDASTPDWPVARADAILCVNMVHISPWAATVGLFTTAAKLLSQGAPLILYGPYIREDHATAPSNLAFDADLKARNSLWGVRRLEDVTELAETKGFALSSVHEMHANNLIVVYRRM